MKTLVPALFVIALTILSSSPWYVANAVNEIVLTRAGMPVVFGTSPRYSLWSQASGIGYSPFFFGLGWPTDPVYTDTTITMGLYYGDASHIYSCRDGAMQLIPINSEYTPQEAIIRVQYNNTDSSYRLQITEANPPVYVQLVLLSQGGLICTPGVPGTPIQFTEVSSSFSSPHVYTVKEHFPQQMPPVLREVVNSAQ